MKEIWKDIEDYKGLYQASNLGNVKSLSKIKNNKLVGKFKTKEKILSAGIDSKGYYSVVLYKNGNKKVCSVHRLVAQTFIPNHENKPCVNHIDGNKLNNNVNNLEWCTYRENNLHALRTGLNPILKGKDNPMYGRHGKNHNHSIPVSQYDRNGEHIKDWVNMREAELSLNITRGKISACCNGNQKTAGGYIWKKQEQLLNKV